MRYRWTSSTVRLSPVPCQCLTPAVEMLPSLDNYWSMYLQLCNDHKSIQAPFWCENVSWKVISFPTRKCFTKNSTSLIRKNSLPELWWENDREIFCLCVLWKCFEKMMSENPLNKGCLFWLAKMFRINVIFLQCKNPLRKWRLFLTWKSFEEGSLFLTRQCFQKIMPFPDVQMFWEQASFVHH